jgi:hypothetical protein
VKEEEEEERKEKRQQPKRNTEKHTHIAPRGAETFAVQLRQSDERQRWQFNQFNQPLIPSSTGWKWTTEAGGSTHLRRPTMQTPRSTRRPWPLPTPCAVTRPLHRTRSASKYVRSFHLRRHKHTHIVPQETMSARPAGSLAHHSLR